MSRYVRVSACLGGYAPNAGLGLAEKTSLIGNSTSSGVDSQRRQLGQPYGRAQITERFEIWVRTWAEVIGDAQHRHKFVQRSLDYTADHDSGIEYMRRKHSQFLPDVMFATDEAPLAGTFTDA
jgi:hypothetical protein